MSARLDDLLWSIDPDRIAEHVSMPLDHAMSSFQLPADMLEDKGPFLSAMGAYWQHLFGDLLGQSISPDPMMASAQAVKYLRLAFGGDGVETAYRMASYGIEGGLYQVLKAVAMEMVFESARIYIRGTIDSFLRQLSYDEQFELLNDYFDRYGHLLRPEFLQGNRERFLGQLLDILEQYPRLVTRLRNIP